MRRLSYQKSERNLDGLRTPNTSPEFSTPIGSYFSIKRAKKGASDESSAKSPFFGGGSKRKKSTTTTEDQQSPDSKPRTPNVDDWNVTRMYDAKPATGSLPSPPPRPRTDDSMSGWCTPTEEIKPFTVNHPVDPPRPAREGHEWVWFPEGYWAERERTAFHDPRAIPKRRKSTRIITWFKSNQRSNTGSEDSWSPKSSRRPPGSSFSKKSSRKSGRESNSGSAISLSKSERFFKGLQSISPLYPRYISPSGQPEGLYCKTKRSIAAPFVRMSNRSRNEEISPKTSRVPSSTTILLEGAASFFEQNRLSESSGGPPCLTSKSFNSTDSKRRKFGLAPWHNRRQSDNSMLSASSSVHNILMGKTPMPTPRSEAQYVGTKGKSYVRVEISESEAPSFLPSEARRISTPPGEPSPDDPPQLKCSLTSSIALSRQGTDLRPAVVRTRSHSPGGRSRLISREPTPRQSLDHEKTRSKSNSTVPSSISAPNDRLRFTLSIPDHLPNSLLCPTNPKHPSIGSGICPLHGRRRSPSPISGIEIRVTSE
ncbi:hypothetical protein ACMFMG_003623 [Clarireedia jacksonii]